MKTTVAESLFNKVASLPLGDQFLTMLNDLKFVRRLKNAKKIPLSLTKRKLRKTTVKGNVLIIQLMLCKVSKELL